MKSLGTWIKIKRRSAFGKNKFIGKLNSLKAFQNASFEFGSELKNV
jgi:hypothetical protein